MSPTAFNVFGLDVRWYGLLIASAIIIGTLLAMKEAKRIKLNPDLIADLVLWVIPAAVIGARLYYVLFTWDMYQHNPWEILNIRQGGLAIHGGLIGAFLAGYGFVRFHRLNFLSLADLVAPSIALGQAIGRWGNFFNQEAHGGIASQSFMSHFPAFIRNQMFIDGQYYHPTFLYESLWCMALFVFLTKFKNFKRTDGELISLYLFLYSMERFVVEGLRTDSLMISSFRIAQLISLALCMAGLIGFVLLRMRPSKLKG